MHAELVVPGLFAAPSPTRMPAAELLIARGRCSSGASRGLEEWLQDAFELGDEPLAAGALTLLASGGDPAGDSWSRADPVHLRLMRDRLLLMPAAALGMTSGEAEALCDALNRHFGGRLALQAIDAKRWVARTPPGLALSPTPPLALAGRDVALAMPADRVVHQLLNEAQMVLHAHAVNEAREARGEPAINSLWLWGGGRLPSSGAPGWQSVSAEEPLVLGLARTAGVRHRTLPATGAAWLERMPEEGRHLVVLDALRAPLALAEIADYHEALARLERDWFAPLLAALRDTRVGMLTIHVPDAGDCAAYETIRGDLRRFWRRPRALEHYA
jgi:hypothetical protein